MIFGLEVEKNLLKSTVFYEKWGQKSKFFWVEGLLFIENDFKSMLNTL